MTNPRALENDEVHRLFACICGKFALRNRTMLICGISMALRATELCRLNVGDLVGANGAIKTYVTIRAETAKWKKPRKVRIGAQVRRALRRFIAYKASKGESLEADAPLFISRQGGYLTLYALFHVVKKILARAGIEESPHCLRKTGATIYYIESGYDLFATQQFLGHTDPSTTRFKGEGHGWAKKIIEIRFPEPCVRQKTPSSLNGVRYARVLQWRCLLRSTRKS